MAVSVRYAAGQPDDVYTNGGGFVLHENGYLSVLDKPVTDMTGNEIAIYAAGQWQRAQID